MGHVMRCLALAEAWKDFEGKPFFLMADHLPGFETSLNKNGFTCRYLSSTPGSDEDAKETIAAAHAVDAEWIVIDGYQFGGRYQDLIKRAGFTLLVIDDYGHADHYSADIILNQNVYAEKSIYQNIRSDTGLLLGTRYALLRKEFQKWADWKREVPVTAGKILVTLGGSDPDNVTQVVIDALKQIKGKKPEVIIVAGAANPHIKTIKESVKGYPFFSLQENVDSMPELMAWADIAISAGGSTCWELAFMGLPNLIIVIAENQQPIADTLDTSGIAVYLGTHTTVSPEKICATLAPLLDDHQKRVSMGRKARNLVNGRGARCVVIRMHKQDFMVRPVTPDDCHQLFIWANDPNVRSSSFHPESIPWDIHVDWFNRKISDPGCSIFIMTTRSGQPVGQIRFDKTGNTAEVDISIDEDFRGCGMGSYLIELGVRQFTKRKTDIEIHARVKKENTSSARAFLNAGFKLSESEKEYGFEVLHVTWRAHD